MIPQFEIGNYDCGDFRIIEQVLSKDIQWVVYLFLQSRMAIMIGAESFCGDNWADIDIW